jgi:hypothetical protein
VVVGRLPGEILDDRGDITRHGDEYRLSATNSALLRPATGPWRPSIPSNLSVNDVDLTVAALEGRERGPERAAPLAPAKSAWPPVWNPGRTRLGSSETVGWRVSLAERVGGANRVPAVAVFDWVPAESPPPTMSAGPVVSV